MTVLRAPFTVPMNVRVELHPDEPPYGLLLRTAMEHGRNRIWTLFQRSGLESGQGVSDLDPDRVAFLCNHDPVEVRATAPRVSPACVGILADEIHRDHFSVVNRRWCPDCLVESDHHRVWWDVQYYVACPKHGIRIAESCGCERRPSWKSSNPLSCRKGHDFRGVVRVQATPDEIALSAYVRDRLLGRRRAVPSLIDETESLGQALDGLDMLGSASLSGRENLNALRARVGRAAVAVEGFRIVSSWPDAYLDMLDRLVASAPERAGARQWGLERAYGRFYIWLDQHAGPDALTMPLRTILAEHARRNVTLMSGRKVAKIEVPAAPGIDLTSASVRWGMTFERFRRVATAIGILPRESLRGRPARLDEGLVAELAPVMRASKTLEEVAGELGIAHHVAAKLIGPGLLPAVLPGGKDRAHRLNMWILRGDSASNLLARLSLRAERGPLDAPYLETISLAARVVRAPLADLIGLVLDGRLTVRAIDPSGTGLRSLLVSTSEAKLALRRSRVAGFTVTEAAAELGWPAAMLTRLRRDGRIAAQSHGRIFILDRGEVDRLRAAYVGTSELQGMLEEGDEPLVHVLKRFGIEPAFVRPEHVMILYPREAAQTAMKRYRTERDQGPRHPTRTCADNRLTREAAAPRMGIDRILLSQLVDARLVASGKGSHGYLIEAGVADAFRKAFVGSTELAPMLGKEGGAAAHAVLKRTGVVPLCATPQFNATIYPRAEAVAAIRAHVAKEEVARARTERRAEARTAGDVLTSSEVREILGMNDTMIAQIGRARHLAVPLRARREGHSLLYSAENVRRFAEFYVLASCIGTMPEARGETFDGNAGVKLLQSLNVTPECSRPRFNSFLYRRDVVANALVRYFDKLERLAAVRDAKAGAREKALTLREVLGILGIGSNQGSALVRAGILPAKVTPSVTLISPRDLDGFRSRYMLFNEISILVDRPSVPGTKIVLDGLGIRPAEVASELDTSIYERIQVERAVTAWKADPTLFVPVQRPPTDKLRACDVRDRLGCNDSLVKRIISEGLLEATTGARVGVMESALEAFRARYALAAEFAAKLGVKHPKAVTSLLDRAGVKPVRADPPYSPKIYLRSEVEAVLSS